MDDGLVELRVRRRRPGVVDVRAVAHLVGTLITLAVVRLTFAVERLA